MRKRAQSNWDDLKYVLAVADHGSVSGAARALEVNHATVLRRIAAFETHHGLRLFDKTPRGYQLSADRRALVDAMREAGAALNAVGRLIASARPEPGAGFRITSTDTLCQLVLPEIAAALVHETGQDVELVSTNLHVDLARQEADLAVRASLALPEDLSGEVAAKLKLGGFGPAGAWSGWVSTSGAVQRSAVGKWMEQSVRGRDVALRADSFLTMATMAASAKMRVILPVIVGRRTPGLVEHAVDDLPPVPVWVASHAELARSGRLAKARNLIAKLLPVVLSGLQD